VARLHDKRSMPDDESRYPPQAVDAAAVVDVLGLVRLRSQLGQCGPRAVRPKIAAFLDDFHILHYLRIIQCER